jgi:hypothetical protein
MDDAQFELLGVVPGDVEGAVKEVTLRMTRAAEEDRGFREGFAGLRESSKYPFDRGLGRGTGRHVRRGCAEPPL